MFSRLVYVCSGNVSVPAVTIHRCVVVNYFVSIVQTSLLFIMVIGSLGQFLSTVPLLAVQFSVYFGVKAGTILFTI